ncbi:MFS Git1p-related glycerophosphoinositol and glycerophosphocholine permease [Globomyces pollinis-pini]|nr:MFS Git1p-related glycerophosphoinositol and glycerophosphocholine permease [Globomyces pollinis-pini]
MSKEIQEKEIEVETENQKFSNKTIAAICGIALLSDGYVNNSVGSVTSILKRQYPAEAKTAKAFTYITSWTYLGTIFGMLAFGTIADVFGRKAGMISANLLLILFTLGCAVSFSPNGTPEGLFWMLVVFRTLLGVAIGAEYPTGSVAASESTQTSGGAGQSIFVLVTSCACDSGFVLSAFVTYIFASIFGEGRLELIWRLTIGFGIIIPTSILWFRVQIHEEKGEKEIKIPYTLIFKKYWPNLFACSAIWFLYDIVCYPVANYASVITEAVLPANAPLADAYFWETITFLFYIPGAIGGAYLTPNTVLGPRNTLILGFFLQAVCGCILYFWYVDISKSVGVFTIFFGLFLSFGELGPGDSVYLISSSSCPSSVRGRFFGIASAVGKVGAYVGSQYFRDIQKWFGNGDETSIDGKRGFFLFAAGINVIGILIAFFLIANFSETIVEEEDEAFKKYIIEEGYTLEEFGLEEKKKIDL